MPFYSLKKIGELAESRSAYLRGVRGYNDGWVQQYDCSSNAFSPVWLSAVLQEGNDTYHAEIGIDENDDIDYAACDCGHFRIGQGLCKHLVAILVHKYYLDMIRQLPTAGDLMAGRAGRKTDAAAQRLIDCYISNETARIDGEETTPVDLIPTLSENNGMIWLTCAVGTDRLYAIKDLRRFAQAVYGKEILRYGKQLTLRHDPENFTENGRQLLDFLLSELDEHSVSPGGKNKLYLSAAGFDRFFALYRGREVCMRLDEEELTVAFRDGEPVLSVTVEQMDDGVRLYGERVTTFYGIRQLYVLYRSTLYRAGKDYSARMREWIGTVHGRKSGLFFEKNVLPSFCSGVLNTVKPYLRIEGDPALLEEYQPLPLEVQIYLDVPEGETDAVTARVLYRYGEKTVQPFLDGIEDGENWRDLLAERRAQLVIRREFTAIQPQTGLLVCRGDEEKLFDFVTRGVEALRQVATVYVSDRFEHISPVSAPQVSVGISLQSGLLEMTVETGSLDPVDLTGIITGYRHQRKYHRLQNGQFVLLDSDVLSGLAEVTDGLSLSDSDLLSGKISLPRYRALYLEKALRERHGMFIRRDERYRGLIERCRAATEHEYPLPDSLHPIMRRYQKSGYRWLRTMEELGFGGILADEMGLGKTLQIIALLLGAKEAGNTVPSLIVCPTSLILNWEREIARFAPSLKTCCIVGDVATRRERLKEANAYDAVITSYDILKRDVEWYEPLSFRYHVLDEAQYIKNSTTQNAKAVKVIRSVQRFALTGTPIENRLSELWSIFDFLMPGVLFSYTKFRTRFEIPIVRQGDERVLERLNRMISPFILRRLKRDVLTELPPKTEQVLPATMETAQKQVYADTVFTLRRQLEAGIRGTNSGQQRIQVLALLTRLRQICCDPRLCCEGYTGESCKLEACVELIKEAVGGGHKVLLFSQFTSMLELIRQRLQTEKISHYLFTGATSKEQRSMLVDAFNADSTSVFLISLKAGGTGLNLTGADMVIHYDPWWNLSAQNQATDRAHRIGQKKPVQVIRLVVRDTVEEKILRLQEDKWQLAESVVGSGCPSPETMTAEELLALLT